MISRLLTAILLIFASLVLASEGLHESEIDVNKLLLWAINARSQRADFDCALRSFKSPPKNTGVYPLKCKHLDEYMWGWILANDDSSIDAILYDNFRIKLIPGRGFTFTHPDIRGFKDFSLQDLQTV
jgi:hypothetical protein